MKKIKFPLEMKDGKMVKEMEEFQEYFDLKRAIEHFGNGKLQKWLENNYDDDILEELEELTGEEDDFIERFTNALGVDYEATDMSVDEVLKENSIKEKLKRLMPEDETEDIVQYTVDSQKDLEILITKGFHKIYLLSESFLITKKMRDLELIGVDDATIEIEEVDMKKFLEQNVSIEGKCQVPENMKEVLKKDIMLEFIDTLYEIVPYLSE